MTHKSRQSYPTEKALRLRGAYRKLHKGVIGGVQWHAARRAGRGGGGQGAGIRRGARRLTEVMAKVTRV